MRLEVDRERCVGAGMCVLTAPEVFGQDEEDGRVRLLDRRTIDRPGGAGRGAPWLGISRFPRGPCPRRRSARRSRRRVAGPWPSPVRWGSRWRS
ncbi:ferredoxin [Amycolatopsis decaplanina]|uniref:4Fe-4S ferredoxin-type domain-containing protein n=1 Tax=Amycolatopsis decaplanina DSM 44594 TaxID=1284240 RepID=M2YDZ1_9PSEU|nr:hypothetical protein H074_32192 [Amycolatopsis decaplanina DSM 44594]